MPFLKVNVTQYTDRGWPECVECVFVDADDCHHYIHEKIPVLFDVMGFSEHQLFPFKDVIDCYVRKKWRDEKGRELVRVSFKHGIETMDGETEFTVIASVVNNKNSGSKTPGNPHVPE